MANDEEWVADVKRWFLPAPAPAPVGHSDDPGDDIALGYEAADPALQAHHWPTPPTRCR